MTATATDLGRQAHLVYRTLLRRPRWRVDALATALGLPSADVDMMVSQLREHGLVTDSMDEQGAIRAVQPSVLPPRAGASLPVTPQPAALDGADEASALVERLVSTMRDEIVFLVPDYLPGSAEFSLQVAEVALSRGVALRSVWSPEVLAAQPAIDHAQWLLRRWSAPRLVPTVPWRAVLVDGVVGVLFDEHGPRMVTGDSAMNAMEKLRRTAERMWQLSAEISSQDGDQPPSPRRQEVVLRLLAVGLTDDAVARRLGISVRTVRNDMASSMTELDARSRFQAGVRAAQLGLI